MINEQSLAVQIEHDGINDEEDDGDNHIFISSVEMMLRGESSSVSVNHSSVLLQGVNHVHGSDSDSLRVLGVGETVPHHSLQEVVDVISHIFMGGVGDALHTSASGQSSDSSVGNYSWGDGFAVQT